MKQFDDAFRYFLEEGVLDIAQKMQQGIDNFQQGMNDPNKGFAMHQQDPDTLKQHWISVDNPPKKGDLVVHQDAQNEPLVVGKVSAVFGANFSLETAAFIPESELLKYARSWNPLKGLPPGRPVKLWGTKGHRASRNYWRFSEQKPTAGVWTEVPNWQSYRFGPDYEINPWMKWKDWVAFFKKMPSNPVVPNAPPKRNRPSSKKKGAKIKKTP